MISCVCEPLLHPLGESEEDDGGREERGDERDLGSVHGYKNM